MLAVSYIKHPVMSVVGDIIIHNKNPKMFPRDGMGRSIWRLEEKMEKTLPRAAFEVKSSLSNSIRSCGGGG